jgi:hypothetical protein
MTDVQPPAGSPTAATKRATPEGRSELGRRARVRAFYSGGMMSPSPLCPPVVSAGDIIPPVTTRCSPSARSFGSVRRVRLRVLNHFNCAVTDARDLSIRKEVRPQVLNASQLLPACLQGSQFGLVTRLEPATPDNRIPDPTTSRQRDESASCTSRHIRSVVGRW